MPRHAGARAPRSGALYGLLSAGLAATLIGAYAVLSGPLSPFAAHADPGAGALAAAPAGGGAAGGGAAGAPGGAAGASQPAGGADAAAVALPPVGGPVFVVGDSLTVGIKPLLGGLVHGRALRVDAEVGRPTVTGLGILERAAQRRTLPTTVVVGLGTNDPPDPAAFRLLVDQALAVAGPGRWVIWVNMSRPSTSAGSWTALNDVLTQAAAAHRNMVVVDWAAAVAHDGRGMLIADGVHGTDYGYSVRAELVAAAVAAH